MSEGEKKTGKSVWRNTGGRAPPALTSLRHQLQPRHAAPVAVAVGVVGQGQRLLAAFVGAEGIDLRQCLGTLRRQPHDVHQSCMLGSSLPRL